MQAAENYQSKRIHKENTAQKRANNRFSALRPLIKANASWKDAPGLFGALLAPRDSCRRFRTDKAAMPKTRIKLRLDRATKRKINALRAQHLVVRGLQRQHAMKVQARRTAPHHHVTMP